MKYITGLLLAGLLILPGIAKADEAAPSAAPVTSAPAAKVANTVKAPGTKSVATHRTSKTHKKPVTATKKPAAATQAAPAAPAAGEPAKAAN